jgi:hypothetical protein
MYNMKKFIMFIALSVFLCAQNERHVLTFYLPKLLIVGMLWISAITMATWQKFNELQDPTYSYKLDTRNYDVSFFSFHKITLSLRRPIFIFFYMGLLFKDFSVVSLKYVTCK